MTFFHYYSSNFFSHRRRFGRGRRLLCWDWLVEVVGFWRLAAVCRQTVGVGSRSLARASSHHRAYRRARKPHVATRPWWFPAPESSERKNYDVWVENRLGLFPDQPTSPISTGFRHIVIKSNILSASTTGV
jgi:hypothetical protein